MQNPSHTRERENNALAISVAEFQRLSSLGKTSTFALIADGRLEARKVGRRTLILMSSVQKLLGTDTKIDQIEQPPVPARPDHGRR